MARWLARRRRPAGAHPRVSVVMPVYNAETTLAECLTRLYNSSFGDFEVVLVDDGSTDQTRVIARNFPVRIVNTSGRVGPAAARNLGARVAEGELLVFIDSDVMIRADTLGQVVERFATGDVEGVVGVQAAAMRHRDLVSQYKNL
jgi:glycosyltransferase involved in cell wall biosynthesis